MFANTVPTELTWCFSGIDWQEADQESDEESQEGWEGGAGEEAWCCHPQSLQGYMGSSGCNNTGGCSLATLASPASQGLWLTVGWLAILTRSLKLSLVRQRQAAIGQHNTTETFCFPPAHSVTKYYRVNTTSPVSILASTPALTRLETTNIKRETQLLNYCYFLPFQ